MKISPFEGLWRYFSIFRRHLGRRLYAIFLLALLAALTEGIGITLLLPLITALDLGVGAAEGTPEPVKEVVRMLNFEDSTAGLLALVWGSFIAKGIITFAYQGYAGILQAELQQQLQSKLFEGIRSADYSYYINHSTGHFVNLTNTQVVGFYQSFTSFQQFLVNCIKATVYFLIAMFLAWKFGVMAIAAGALTLVLLRYLSGLIKRLSVQSSSEMSVLNKLLVQAVQAFKYLTATNTMGGLSSRIEASLDRVREYRSRQFVWQAFTGAISEPLSVTLVLGIMVIQVGVLSEPIAPILVAILLFHRAMSTLMTLQSQWQQSMGTIGSVEVIENELNALENSKARGGPTVAPDLSQRIVLTDVSYSYPGNTAVVLSSLSLEIPARQTIALVGRSGSGKSTLVDLLTLLLRPQTGRFFIDGVSAESIEPASWRRQIGYVSQENVVFDDSIARNITMHPISPDQDSETLERILQALHDAHLGEVIKALPQGVWTMVGDRGIRLSGGQRQRLFIARELFRRPRLLILDEATSALDSESEAAVQASIDSLKGQITIVVIAHRLSTVRNADRIYVLADGKIVEEGTYSQLKDSDAGRFAAMVEMQTL